MQSEDHLLLVLHVLPAADELTRKGVFFWYDGQGNWKCSNGSWGIASLREHLKTFATAIDDLDRQEELAQEADQYLRVLDQLTPLQRTVRNLFDVLSEARKAAPQVRDLIDARDSAYDVSRSAELLFSDTKNAMDVAMIRRAEEQARIAHRMAESAHRLNILVAVFFPLATFGTILGTTLTENWSWSHSAIPFVLFLVVGTICGIVLARMLAPGK